MSFPQRREAIKNIIKKIGILRNKNYGFVIDPSFRVHGKLRISLEFLYFNIFYQLAKICL